MLLTYIYSRAFNFITLLIAKSKAKEARIVLYYNLLTTYSTYKIRIYLINRNAIKINTFKFKLFYKMSKINYKLYKISNIKSSVDQ